MGKSIDSHLLKGTDDYPRFSEMRTVTLCLAGVSCVQITALQYPFLVLPSFLSSPVACFDSLLSSWWWQKVCSCVLWLSYPAFCFSHLPNGHVSTMLQVSTERKYGGLEGECWGQQAAGFCLGYLWHLCPWVMSSRLHYVLIFLPLPGVEHPPQIFEDLVVKPGTRRESNSYGLR